MKNIIPAIIVLVFVIVGSFAGKALQSPSEKSADAHEAESSEKPHDDHAKADDDGHQKKAKSKGHGKKSEGKSDVTYFKFSREFIVPIMRDSKVQSLVIININLEVDSGIAQEMFSMEPKLRDNIMTSLVGLSTDGRTLDDPTNAESYETIRSVVLMNLQGAVSTGVQNVLILDMAKQEF